MKLPPPSFPTDRVVKELPIKAPDETVEELLKRLCPEYKFVEDDFGKCKEKIE